MIQSKPPILYMLIGPPYSGKSTWYKELMELPNQTEFKLIDTDSILEIFARTEGISYNEAFPKYINEATHEMFKRAADAITQGYNICWDQTNMTKKSRAKKLAMFPSNYSKCAVVCLKPEVGELKSRMAMRSGKKISESIIDKMVATYQPPEYNEGFDEILFL